MVRLSLLAGRKKDKLNFSLNLEVLNGAFIRC